MILPHTARPVPKAISSLWFGSHGFSDNIKSNAEFIAVHKGKAGEQFIPKV